jgi:polar amino acid transport system substrate-binding protein
VIQELTPTEVLRAAINLGNPVLAQPGDAGGEPKGVSVALARELARRLGVRVVFATYDAAGKVVDANKFGAWDVAFLAIDPLRAKEILFTAPYVIIEGTYLVRDNAPYRAVDALDKPGVRIAVGKGAAYDLYLSRTLKHAELVRSATSAEALEQFLADGLEAAAGVRQPLVKFAQARPGLRVLDGRFTAIEQAVATPIGRTSAHAFLKSFVEEMKASGFVAKALDASGQRDATVAPPA